MSEQQKPHVRWQLVSDAGSFTCWRLNGDDNIRIIVGSKRKKQATDERVLSVLRYEERRKRRRQG